MLIKKGIGKMNAHYNWAFEYFENNFDKEKRNYRILDVGAAASPWAIDWLTHIADVFTDPKYIEKFNDKDIKVFRVNIEDSLEWDEILKDVKKNGKFDFVICSHTLEDLNNPSIACKMINKIGKAGFVSMPSKYAEQTVFEGKEGMQYKGYHHHRWIYSIKNDTLIGYPKMNFFDYIDMNGVDWNAAIHTEIAFMWENNFDYEFVFPDQLLDNRYGPNRVYELYEDDDLVL